MERITLTTNMELLKEYLVDCELRALSPETIRSKKSNIRIIAKLLDKQKINFTKVDKTELKKILSYLRNQRKVSIKTQKHYFSDLSNFYDFLVYEEKATKNPITPFRKRYLNNYKKNRN